ncbi:MAG: glycoside hydrolase family 28 protein [Leadbetterella sp.]
MRILSLFFCIAIVQAYSQNTGVIIEKKKVEAPFKMPRINVPNFSKCKKYELNTLLQGDENQSHNTKKINAALQEASNNQGGVVIVPKGIWAVGNIVLKSNTNLHLEKGATLEFSGNPQDYLPVVATSWEGMECLNYSPLIFGENLKNVKLSGNGEIKAKMETWSIWFSRDEKHISGLKKLYYWSFENKPMSERNITLDEEKLRPHFIQFSGCQNVHIQDLKITNSPFWTVHLYKTNDVLIQNLNIKANGHNNDGIDPEMSQNVLIENCIFDQGDDAISVKSGRDKEAWRINMPAKNIVIRNCIVKNGHQLLAIGSELSGGIENVLVENCVIDSSATNKIRHLLFIKTNERRGGYVKNIYIRNIAAAIASEGILGIDTDVLYQWRNLTPTLVKKLTPIENVFCENITLGQGAFICKINGNSELPVKNVYIKNAILRQPVQEPYILKHVENFVKDE